MGQVVARLPSKHETLSSNPSVRERCLGALVAHAYNPSYSGGRGQEDRGLKPARANSSRDPISKKPITNGWSQEDPGGRGQV
jgi:hypothetical protein